MNIMKLPQWYELQALAYKQRLWRKGYYLLTLGAMSLSIPLYSRMSEQ